MFVVACRSRFQLFITQKLYNFNISHIYNQFINIVVQITNEIFLMRNIRWVSLLLMIVYT